MRLERQESGQEDLVGPTRQWTWPFSQRQATKWFYALSDGWLFVVWTVGLKRLKRDHKRQRHPSSISTHQNENKKCHLLFDATYLTNCTKFETIDIFTALASMYHQNSQGIYLSAPLPVKIPEVPWNVHTPDSGPGILQSSFQSLAKK